MREQQAAIARSRAGAFARGVGFGRTEADMGAADAERAGHGMGSESDSDEDGPAGAGTPGEDLHRIGVSSWPGPWSTAMAIEGGMEAARERREHSILVESLTGEERERQRQKGLAESEDAALVAAWALAERVLAQGAAEGAEDTWGPRKKAKRVEALSQSGVKAAAAAAAAGDGRRDAWDDEDDVPEGWVQGDDQENSAEKVVAASVPRPSRKRAASGTGVVAAVIQRKNPRVGASDAASFPSLFELASTYLASLVADEDFDTEGSLAHLPDEVRRRLARTLARGRLLDGAALEALAEGSPAELHVEDLTGTDEEALGKVFAKLAAGGSGTDGLSSELRGTAALTALHLGMAGRGLGTRSVGYLLPLSDDGGSRGEKLLPNLRKLFIQGAYRLEDADLVRILENSPKLEDLTLEACTKLSGASVRAAAKSCEGLARVSLKGCFQFTDEDVDALNDIPTLTGVSLHGLSKVSDAAVQALCATAGHRLTSLNLGRCSMVTGQAVAEAVASMCPNLEHLWLDECDTLTSRGAKKLAAGCNRLRTLSLRGCARVGDKGLARICAANRSLEKLCLSGVRGLTDAGLAAIAHHCRPCLVELDLGWCRMLTAKAVAAVAAACPELRKMGLWGNARMDLAFSNGMRALLPRVTLVGLYGRGALMHL